ncbi:MAG: hypothetical protein ACRC8W_03080 [Plesiomonas shigelloides]
MNNHNPSPWRFGDMYNSIVCDTYIFEIKGSDAVDAYGGHMICESVAKRNAARIIACVNACEGVSNEDLIEGASVKEIIGQRDDLLSALKQVLSYLEDELSTGGQICSDDDAIRAVIEKVEGKK